VGKHVLFAPPEHFRVCPQRRYSDRGLRLVCTILGPVFQMEGVKHALMQMNPLFANSRMIVMRKSVGHS